jgi:hypothetical protein
MMPPNAPDRLGLVPPVGAKQILRARALVLEIHARVVATVLICGWSRLLSSTCAELAGRVA